MDLICLIRSSLHENGQEIILARRTHDKAGDHHVHHLNSRIPFYLLPMTMAAIPEFPTSRTTSLHPLEIIRCLRLKRWDSELQRRQRSISLRELAVHLPTAMGVMPEF